MKKGCKKRVHFFQVPKLHEMFTFCTRFLHLNVYKTCSFRVVN